MSGYPGGCGGCVLTILGVGFFLFIALQQALFSFGPQGTLVAICFWVLLAIVGGTVEHLKEKKAEAQRALERERYARAAQAPTPQELSEVRALAKRRSDADLRAMSVACALCGAQPQVLCREQGRPRPNAHVARLLHAKKVGGPGGWEDDR